ncbi:MAG TPA: hypothetical protein VE620_03345 [Myxococcales bacterium]|jgi:hypothetical protein|nr:hypothetical protein [Myxococcales bacterium]
MADIRKDPRYPAIADLAVRGVSRAEARRFFEFAMEMGQQLFMDAFNIARAEDPAQTAVLLSAILEAAWARAAADIETHQVLGEQHGLLIGLEERLTASADAIRRLYYPQWRALLEQQDPRHRRT